MNREANAKVQLTVPTKMWVDAKQMFNYCFCLSSVNFMKTNHHFNDDEGSTEMVERINKKILGDQITQLYGLKFPKLVRAVTHAFGIIPVEIWFQSAVKTTDLHHYFQTRSQSLSAGNAKYAALSQALYRMESYNWFGFMYKKHSESINILHAWTEICRADPCMTHQSAGLYGCTRITSIIGKLDKAVADVAPYAIAYMNWVSSSLGKALSLKQLSTDHKIEIEGFEKALKRYANWQGDNQTPMSYFVDATEATLQYTAYTYEKAQCERLVKDIGQ